MRDHNALVVLATVGMYAIARYLISIATAPVSRWRSERAARNEHPPHPARRRTDSAATGAGFSQPTTTGAAPRHPRGGRPAPRRGFAYPPLRAVPDEDHAA